MRGFGVWVGKPPPPHPQNPHANTLSNGNAKARKVRGLLPIVFCPRRRTDSGNRQGLFPFFYYTGVLLSMSFAKFKRLSTMVIVNSLIILSAVVDKGLSRFSPRRRQMAMAHHLPMLQSLLIFACRRLSQAQDSLPPLKQFYGLQQG